MEPLLAATGKGVARWNWVLDGRAWWVLGVTTNRIRLSDFTFTLHVDALEEEMATHSSILFFFFFHSSILAWRVPGTGEPGGLLSMGLHRVGHE